MGPVGIGHSLKVKEATMASVRDTNKISVVDKRPHNVDKNCRHCDLPQTSKVATSKMDHRSRWGHAVLPRPTYNVTNVAEKKILDGSQNLSLARSIDVPLIEKDARRKASKEEFSDRFHVLELPCGSVETPREQ